MSSVNVPAPTAPVEQRYTREDLRRIEALPENANKVFELLNGRLYLHESSEDAQVPPPSYLHAFIVSILVEILMEYLLKNRIGRLFMDNTGYDLPGSGTVIPDLSFVSQDRLLPVTATGVQPIAPDLAIEVVSPSNTPELMSDKISAYLSGGVKVVWVVYPLTRSVDVYTSESEGRGLVN
ncbi:MAG: Uma2 family endonuclease, partial [Anaerolineae bacterium]|nr:Uma2 family endonuclease [Anaerolineae bacterium]